MPTFLLSKIKMYICQLSLLSHFAKHPSQLWKLINNYRSSLNKRFFFFLHLILTGKVPVSRSFLTQQLQIERKYIPHILCKYIRYVSPNLYHIKHTCIQKIFARFLHSLFDFLRDHLGNKSYSST